MGLFSIVALSAALTVADFTQNTFARSLNEQTGSCIAACKRLTNSFPGQVLQRNTSAYHEFTGAYWAEQQQDISPRCVFQPADASEVAVLIRLVQETQCPFAVRGGGHGAFSGVSNIPDGIVVSLMLLNEIIVSEDSTRVSVGAGNRWLDVYKSLENRGITIAGGRYPTVGVGGLSVGGGASFFANARGWTCDNILGYELITANGSIIQVSNTSFPDLHWALRGGGNNFGLITKLRFEAFPLRNGLMWGGLRVSFESEIPAILQAAYNLGTIGAESDPGVGQIINVVRYRGIKVAVAILSYIDPIERPPVMAEFLSIPTVNASTDSTRVRTLTNLSAELGGDNTLGEDSGSKRRGRGTAAFRLSVEMLTYVKDVCFEEFDSAAYVEELDSVCVFQVITRSQLTASEHKGGNAFGLDSADGPLFLLNVVLSWPHAADDVRAGQVSRNIIERATEHARARGWDMDFLYMNYAGEFQDVFSGYGAVNKARLAAIAEKYDPTGVFQRLQPGYFKLAGLSSST
ncbi:hypothetical protein DL771_007755 [Monosporascus sp. 5C6A]|nr:hypothetical protein DL771_007755 [Monosporascus sp. 5C6A]